MQSLPSYIKDTTDFITKLKQFQVTSEKAYIVSLVLVHCALIFPMKTVLEHVGMF